MNEPFLYFNNTVMRYSGNLFLKLQINDKSDFIVCLFDQSFFLKMYNIINISGTIFLTI